MFAHASCRWVGAEKEVEQERENVTATKVRASTYLAHRWRQEDKNY